MPKKELSEFFCKELIYDYVDKTLPEEKSKSFEAGLKKFPGVNSDLQKVKRAIDYCNQLEQVSFSPDFVRQVSGSWDIRRLLKAEWASWSPLYKWSLQALVLAAFLAGLYPYVFKDFLRSRAFKTTILAEAPSESLVKEPILENQTAEQSPAGNSVAANSIPPTPDERSSEIVAAVEPTKEAASSVNAAKTTGKGYVYRGYLSTATPELFSGQLVTFLNSNGAEKGGEVDLGWRRNDGFYFHFIYPENQYENLLAHLKSNGRVRIEKSEHKRVMPEGKIRIILIIESPLTKDESRNDENQPRSEATGPATQGEAAP